MSSLNPVITIDGPAGVGKGTLACRLASCLQFHYLDSGALYRSVALYALKMQQTSAIDLVEWISGLSVDFQLNKDLSVRMLLNGEDVSQAIRAEAVSRKASDLARIPEIRQELLAKQRQFSTPAGLVTDGRDMGTVVFPDAALKIYLDADLDIRVGRRLQQLKKSNADADPATLTQSMRCRDRHDTERSIAPLQPASNAVVIDSGQLNAREVFEFALQQVVNSGLHSVGHRVE